MQNYIIRRLLQGILVLVASSIIIFVVMRVLPSDPVLTGQALPISGLKKWRERCAPNSGWISPSTSSI